ncbi:MAG: hypothetical protein M3140_01205 [Actinomycetota bacterium]|nr:hypothetical protein [Actinomycetota bacterium]
MTGLALGLGALTAAEAFTHAAAGADASVLGWVLTGQEHLSRRTLAWMVRPEPDQIAQVVTRSPHRRVARPPGLLGTLAGWTRLEKIVTQWPRWHRSVEGETWKSRRCPCSQLPTP